MKDPLNLPVGVVARLEDRRIAYYRVDGASGSDLWDSHWSSGTFDDLERFYEPYRRGYMEHGSLRRVLLRHLPKRGLILEGGCGMSQYVVALRARGYNCIGIDFAAKTVERVKSVLPDLPVEVGDVCYLSLEDESLDAYISLGVMEHFEDGPDSAVNEASRVLKRNAVFIVSVPHAFRWRRLNSNPEGTPLPDNAAFYQYAFTPEEFKAILLKSGFEVEGEYGYGSHYAFRIRFKIFRKLLNRFPQLAHIDLLVDKTPIGRNLSRMRLYVAKKK